MNIGFLAVFSAAVIFGSAGVFAKTLEIPATVIACFRVLIPAGLILLTRRDLRTKLFSNPNKRLLAASLLTAGRILLWVLGFIFAAISKAVVMLYTWPIFLTVLGAFFLGEKVSRRTKLLLLTAFVGILVVYSGEEISLENKDLVGMVLMLGVAIINAIVMTIFKKELQSYSPVEVVLYDNFVGSIVFLPFLFYHFSSLQSETVGLGVLYGFLIGFVGSSLLYFGLARIKASVASVLCYMEVVSASLFGIIFFKEVITWNMITGACMILGSAALVRNEKK